MRTIKDIKVGDRYFHREHCEQHVEIYEVTAVRTNPDGGKPVRDMWGSHVWDEPMYVIESRSLKDGHKSGVAVHSDKEDLSWLEWCGDEKEARKKIYGYRRERYLSIVSNALDKISADSVGFPLYADCLDDSMRRVLEKVEELKDTIMYAEILKP